MPWGLYRCRTPPPVLTPKPAPMGSSTVSHQTRRFPTVASNFWENNQSLFFSAYSLFCLMHLGKPTGAAVSHCITWFQTQLILVSDPLPQSNVESSYNWTAVSLDIERLSRVPYSEQATPAHLGLDRKSFFLKTCQKCQKYLKNLEHSPPLTCEELNGECKYDQRM